MNERLADVLSQDPDITGQDVLTAVEEGDRLARTARWLCVLSVVAALTFVLVRLVGRRRRPVTGSARRAMRRRPGRPMPARTDDADADVGLVPQPWEQPDRPRRLIAAISLAAWLLLPILTGIQLALSMSSSRDDAEGGRRATTLTASLLASQLYQGFWSAARQSEVHSSMLGLARQFVATYGDDTDQAQLGVAETEAADQWTRIGVTMTRAPKLSDGVHARIVEMVNSSPDDHILLLEQQHAAVEAAQRRGDAGNLATLALLLVGLTATVTAWASPSGQRGPLATVGAISLVSSAAVLGIVAGWGGLA